MSKAQTARVEAGDGGEWSVWTAGGVADVRLHGAIFAGVARGEQVDLRPGRPIGPRVSGSRRPDPSGRLTAWRPAMPAIAGPRPIAFVADLPELSRAAGGFPVATVATAAITAGVAALFFSPIFAMLAGVSALAVVGRWLGAIVGRRRSERRLAEATADAVSRWETAARRWASEETAARCERALGPDETLPVLFGDVSPWWERLDAGSVLDVVVGRGDVDVEIAVADVAELDRLGAVLDRTVRLSAVPLEVRLDPGAAVCGDRADVLACARWIVGSTLSRLGPADLSVILVTTSDRVLDWDQLKWSPSLAGCVVVDVDRDDALAEAIDGARGHAGDADRSVLVVVDGAEPTGSGLLARVLSGRVDGLRLLWLGAVDAVPAGCRSSLSVAADGSGWLDHLDGGGGQRVDWYGFDDGEWSQVMRWLARFVDPECDEDGHALPPAVALSDLVAPVHGAADPDRFAGDLHRRWSRANNQRLTARIGVDAEGPVEVDLVADGPHVLAAGTTGAGKSELLRTMVVGLACDQPPEVVSFVLVDFKGGGAFDAVAALPHVAAVVTDLDPSEASRALRGLRAEILDREHRLRDMEVSDVSDIDRSHQRAFGRLVVIVDEFAALADELPDFLDGLIDIARRGRSLGVHLVLATQRPSGVVTGQIRANTNLRLCLRVQDRSDSIDVVDDVAAGLLPPIPGRAVMRRGGGRCEPIQVARVSGERDRMAAVAFKLHDAALVERAEADAIDLVDRALDCIGADGVDETPLVDRVVLAAPDRARAAAPWTTAPRAVSFPVGGAAGGSVDGGVTGGGAAVIGLLDDPDRRVISPLVWRPATDGLLVVGADEAQLAATAAVAVAAALDVDAATPVFVLDGDRKGCAALGELGALDPVIDVVGVDEPERLLRAVEQLERTKEPRLVVVHHWSAVADALVDIAGPLGAERLHKLVRRAGTPGSVVIVTARSERDVPQRVLGSLGCRVIHRLADPGGLLSFGLRAADVGTLDGGACVEPTTGLVGVVAALDGVALAALAERVAAASRDQQWPEPIRVLGARVERAELPPGEAGPRGWRVPLGRDADMAPQWVHVAPLRPVLVLGHAGGGRTTALTTIADAVDDPVCVIDDADLLDDDDLVRRVSLAEAENLAIVVGCTPAQAKRFGSPIADLLHRSTVVLLNPSRTEGDLVRLPLPDLTAEPVGRAVLVDRGRATVVQIAA